ncbi:MAG: hypothetical protein PHE27_07180, partial [Alphaproteobacteria bacterium]|nr:hypothetical protein [Alphaproteobacteria bacterium]
MKTASSNSLMLSCTTGMAAKQRSHSFPSDTASRVGSVAMVRLAQDSRRVMPLHGESHARASHFWVFQFWFSRASDKPEILGNRIPIASIYGASFTGKGEEKAFLGGFVYIGPLIVG